MTVLSVLVFFALADNVDTYLVTSDMEVYLLLISVLCILFINRQFKNEILEFMNTFFVFFYIIRIPFIFIDSASSDVLIRDVNIDNIPWYLFVLVVQYLSFAVAIIVVNPRISKEVITNVVSEKVFKRVLFFCVLVLFLNILRRVFYFDIQGGDTLNFFWSILGSIFTGKNILMTMVVMLFVSEKGLISKYKYTFYSIVLMTIAEHVYGGSKSIIFEFFLLLYLGSIVVHGPLKLSISRLIMMLFGGVFAVFAYFFGILSRGLHVGNYEYNVSNLIYLYNEVFEFNIGYFVSGFSYRIGYLDFFLQKISLQVYELYVNFQYYFESIIDRITPGFDIYGVPYTAAALYSAYYGESESGAANSEFVTIFGEGYIIFGFFSFFFYVAILLFIKYLIFKSRSPYTFNTTLFRLFIMMIFYLWLRGPGLDMVFLFAIYKGIFVLSIMAIVKYCNINPRIHIITQKSVQGISPS